MSPPLRLLPNVGAEEGDDWRRFLSLPAVATLVRLWRGLYGADATLVGLDPDRAAALDRPWPDTLGPHADEPVLPWLLPDATRADTTIPWLATTQAPGESSDVAEVVRRVHDKAFALRVAESEGLVPRPLRGLAQVLEPAELRDADAALGRLRATCAEWPAWTAGRFVLKPRLGTSGRGRVSGRAADLDADGLRAALPRLVSRGGAVLEPELDRVADHAVVLRVDGPDAIWIAGSLEPLVGAAGQPLGHRGSVDSRGRVFSDLSWDEDARAAAAIVAGAAAREGLRGPCGVDGLAFRWRRDGEERVDARPVVELNARATTGLVTLGLVRRALDGVRAPLGLEPGRRIQFELRMSAPADGWRTARATDGLAFIDLRATPDDVPGPALCFARERAALDAALGPV